MRWSQERVDKWADAQGWALKWAFIAAIGAGILSVIA